MTEDFTTTWTGRYYTVNMSKKLGPDYELDFLIVSLFYTNYIIWIHDPNFFIINLNPTSLPSLMKIVEPNNTSSHYYCLTTTPF